MIFNFLFATPLRFEFLPVSRRYTYAIVAYTLLSLTTPGIAADRVNTPQFSNVTRDPTEAVMEFTVSYPSKSSQLQAIDKKKLDDVIERLKAWKLRLIILKGHAETVEVPVSKKQEELSVKRAQEVKSYLVAKGIDQNLIYAEGKGAKEELADDDTIEGRAKNRRVEIEIVVKKIAN